MVVLGIGVLAFWLLANTSLRLGTKLFPADEDENEGCFVLIVAIFSVVVAMLPLAGAIWLAARI